MTAVDAPSSRSTATARSPADVVGKPDLVKCHHMPLRPGETARAMSLATCVRDWRKPVEHQRDRAQRQLRTPQCFEGIAVQHRPDVGCLIRKSRHLRLAVPEEGDQSRGVRGHLRMRGPDRMAVERRGPGVEPRQVHRPVADLEDLVEGHGGVPACAAPPPDGRAGGEDDVDRARLGVDGCGQNGRAPQLHRQGDQGRHRRVGHGPIPSLVRMRGRPPRWPDRPPARSRFS